VNTRAKYVAQLYIHDYCLGIYETLDAALWMATKETRSSDLLLQQLRHKAVGLCHTNPDQWTAVDAFGVKVVMSRVITRYSVEAAHGRIPHNPDGSR
jgi:hypothetical protein